jgi:hypothetical protein
MKKAVCKNCISFGKKGCTYPKEVGYNDAACAAYVESQKSAEEKDDIPVERAISRQGW